MKLVFVDVEGVLMTPNYKNGYNSSSSIEPDTRGYVISSACKNCKAPDTIKDYISKLHKDGTIIYSISCDSNSFSFNEKNSFIKSNYGDWIGNNLFVSDETEKGELISAIAEKYGVSKSSCLLIDDNIKVLGLVSNVGVNTMHLSELV